MAVRASNRKARQEQPPRAMQPLNELAVARSTLFPLEPASGSRRQGDYFAQSWGLVRPLLGFPLGKKLPASERLRDSSLTVLLPAGGREESVETIDTPHGGLVRGERQGGGNGPALHPAAVQIAGEGNIPGGDIWSGHALIPSGLPPQPARWGTCTRVTGRSCLLPPFSLVTSSGQSMIAKTVNRRRPPKARFLPHKEIPAPLPILCEPCSLLEFAALRLSPVYYGLGVPAGDGTAVVIIPGLLGMDLTLFELHGWLTRVGYRAYFSGMGLAADCPNVLAKKLTATIDRAYVETGQRVHLIGYSLGGIFARSAAVRMPGRIASVTTLGSPFRGLVVHPLVLTLGNLVRHRIRRRYPNPPQGCATSRCSCAFARSLRRKWPRSVAQTAIYTREDGLVDWRYCRTGDPKVDVEVGGTHLGLIFNSTTYLLIAERLAAVSGKRTAKP